MEFLQIHHNNLKQISVKLIYPVFPLLDKSNNTPIAIEDSFQMNLFDNLLGH
jgi:hypothetical protein